MKNITVFLIIITTILLFEPVFGQEITASAGWWFHVPTSGITNAGLDYTENYTSSQGQIAMSISHKKSKEKKGYYWNVSIYRSDTDWDDRLKLFVKRTNDGIPLNPTYHSYIMGGEVFQEITTFDQQLFSGLRGFDNIKLQFELRGSSVLIPAKRYGTDIIYTLTAP